MLLSIPMRCGRLHAFEVGLGRTGGLGGLERLDACADRNLAADDDIFLETAEMIDAAVGGGVDEDAGCILEGCGGKEGVGPDGDLGDTEEQAVCGGRGATGGFELAILVLESRAANDVANDEGAVARLGDQDAVEHLADDDFEVFGGNLVALGGVDGHDVVHDVALGSLGALVTQEILDVEDNMISMTLDEMIHNNQQFKARLTSWTKKEGDATM